MSSSLPVVLNNDKALVGESDLGGVFEQFKRHKSSSADANANLARFKKKEPLESLAKSVLKHRLQTLTGRSMATMEQALGFSIKSGRTMDVQQVRWLAHLLILKANGVQDNDNDETAFTTAVKEPEPAAPGRKRRVGDSSPCVQPDAAQPLPAAKKARSTRRSLMPTPSADVADASPSIGGRARAGRRSLAPETLLQVSRDLKRAQAKKAAAEAAAAAAAAEVPAEEEEEEQGSDDDESDGLVNPTPQMLELKRKLGRRSLAPTPTRKLSPAKKAATPAKKAAMPAKKTATPKSKPAPPPPVRPGFPGASFFASDDRETNSQIYLLNGDPSVVTFRQLRSCVPSFPGAALSVLHTPAEWQPPEVFNMVKSIRQLNKEAGLSSFLVLAGCGLSNVHMFREALARQTRHVQFVVFERDDQNLQNAHDGRLRETSSYFLLAYFFPGCDREDSKLPGRMVREGATTVFHTKSIEDLENAIVHSLSEENDWILDLCCKKRELSLAAQKAGRFALAVEEEEEQLVELRRKAWAIAKHHDDTFAERDGSIIKMD